MAEEYNKDIIDSQKDNRERLQKSMRDGLLNVKKSVDSMHATFNKSLKVQEKQLKQAERDAAFARETLQEQQRKAKSSEKQAFFKNKGKEGFLAKLSSMGILDAASLANQNKNMGNNGVGNVLGNNGVGNTFGTGSTMGDMATTYAGWKGFKGIKNFIKGNKPNNFGARSKLSGIPKANMSSLATPKGPNAMQSVLGKSSKPLAMQTLKSGLKGAFRFVPGLGWAYMAYEVFDFMQESAEKRKQNKEEQEKLRKVVEGKSTLDKEFPDAFAPGAIEEKKTLLKKLELKKKDVAKYGTSEEIKKIQEDAKKLKPEQIVDQSGADDPFAVDITPYKKETKTKPVEKMVTTSTVTIENPASKLFDKKPKGDGKFWVRDKDGNFVQREKSQIGDTEFNREMFDSDEEYATFLKDKESFYQKQLAIDAAEEKKKPRGEGLKPKARSTSKLMGEEPKKAKTISQKQYDNAKAKWEAYEKVRADAEKEREDMMNKAQEKFKAGEITGAQRDEAWGLAKSIYADKTLSARKKAFGSQRILKGVERGTLAIKASDVSGKVDAGDKTKGSVVNKASGELGGNVNVSPVVAPNVNNSTTNNVSNQSSSTIAVSESANRNRKSPIDDYRLSPEIL